MTSIDTIRQFADDFTEEYTHSSFAKIIYPLRDKLATLDSIKDKRTFLKYIKLNIQHELEVHQESSHPFGDITKNCGYEIHTEKYLFYINQELSIIEKFEEKEKNNFLSQFSNEVLIPSLLTLLAIFGTLAYNWGYYNSKIDFLFSKIEPPTTIPKKISDTATTNASKKGIKNDSVKIPIGKP
ncbi:hypothetical protein [Emticicia sp. SJ17W-69]|uniref:hypothetical protein n=1 Tax=Emticicia sp. SJ17W-69 TaxID=3421657 RepID=UPI003EC0EC23